MEKISKINNAIYEDYGDRWYTSFDDPIALLRAENKVKVPWILSFLEKNNIRRGSVIDVGCGGGFLSNELALAGFKVTGVDLSCESLKVAQAHDQTGSVIYHVADAFKLPYPDESFDIITAMDFLEHVEDPALVIKEFSRVLRPRGFFFFHTFNRNILSWLIIIKLVEWFIKNTPKNMHVIDLFIKPQELREYCQQGGMEVVELTGLRPVLSSIDFTMLRTGVVARDMRFTLTASTLLSYLGVAQKTQ